MSGHSRRGAVVAVGTVAATCVAASGLAGCSGASTARTGKAPAPWTTRVFASSKTLSSPDDITQLGQDVFVAWQNGVGSKGEPSPQGRKSSTVVEYSPSGHQLDTWDVTGKIDGMAADRGLVAATVNEDGNTSLYTIAPQEKHGAVRHYRYSPNPLPHGGGTDSVAFSHGAMFVSASAPVADKGGTTYSKPALYRVALHGSVASTSSVLADNTSAKNAVTGQTSKLSLSDPDSDETMPSTSPQYAGDVLLDSQGDSQQVFVHAPGTSHPSATALKLPTQVDDTAVATSKHGTLFVVDNGTNKVLEMKGQFQPGQVFTSVADDAPKMPGTLGILNLRTGKIATAAKVKSPAGLLFMR